MVKLYLNVMVRRIVELDMANMPYGFSLEHACGSRDHSKFIWLSIFDLQASQFLGRLGK